MKITDIRVIDLQSSRTPDTLKRHLCTPTSRFRDAFSAATEWFGPVALSLVEVVTNEGLTGIGSIGGFTSAGGDVIDTYFKPLAIGESPFNTELLWEKMSRSTVRFGRRGAAVAAISAIDIACWDIKGKALGRPVYNLLVGETQEHVPAYASRLYALEDLSLLEPDTGNELFWKVFRGEPRAIDGQLVASDAPRLGIDIDWRAVERLRR